MPYVTTTWTNGASPALNATNLNKIEAGILACIRKDGTEAMTAQLTTVAGTVSTPAIAPTGDSNTGIFFPAADTIAFGEGGLEAMRINSSSQIGIGTISPTALVSMHGAPQATSGAILTLRDTTASGGNTTYGAITFLSSPGTDFSIGKASENANSALAFRNANTGAEFMRIDSNGYVSIGATSAGAAKLRVEDASSAKIYSVRTGGATLLIEGGSASGFVKTITNSNLNLGANNTDHMTITTAGNVGIGTASPDVGSTGNRVLTVTGAFTRGRLQLQNTDGGVNAVAGTVQFLNNTLSLGDITVKADTNSGGSGFMTFTTGGNERMRLTSGGSFGIGLTPTAQLQLSLDSATKPSTNTWTIASDARIKTVKREYTKGLQEICSLRPVVYEYNGKAGFIADGKENISIVAQEAKQYFPECVGVFSQKLEETDEQATELYNWNGHAVTFALINAVKELNEKIATLEAKLAAK